MTPPAASSSDSPYQFITRVHTTWFDTDQNRALEGWEIRARWIPTGTILKVRLPDASYTAQAVDNALRAAGAQDEQIAKLGASSG